MEAGLADTSAVGSPGIGYSPIPKKRGEYSRTGTTYPFTAHIEQQTGAGEFPPGRNQVVPLDGDGSRVSLARLPSRQELSEMAGRFERAVREEDPEASAIGERLYKSLFRGMPASVELRPSWLLALDDALFQIPLSALVTGAKAGRPVYLTEKHSLEIVPGAWAVGTARGRVGTFAGIADPVYNSADPRSRGTTASFSLAPFGAHPVEFSRLPSSRQEIEACAREYSGPPAVLLSGLDASRKGLQLALESNPAVLHLATHVVASAETGQEALIMLSGTTPGRVDAVTTADILAMRVPGSLVVLSGRGSARGAVRRGPVCLD